VAFVYDAATLEYKQAYSYPREGWGLTTDGKSLIASDGSSKLYFLTPEFQLERSVDVKMDGRSMRNLNELEYIDGKVWANVYTTDMILIINPADGKVEASIDCTGLLPRILRSNTTDVLNGIARDPATGKIYLTGKYWPRLYEIKLVPVK
ncbi:MAG: glutaminyl-peptide cyclotransferase, partial [Bacteroidales bacterium]|nr:glutaminyl-peptide cyclotransferase [Bacteroidales bacterium]